MSSRSTSARQLIHGFGALARFGLFYSDGSSPPGIPGLSRLAAAAAAGALLLLGLQHVL